MYEEAAAQNARELISQCGRVLEVSLKTNGEIDVVFERGAVATLGSIFKYGYMGTGPTCFTVWLRTAGFNVTGEEVSAMKAPKTLRPPGVSEATIETAKKAAVQAEEARVKREAEEAQRRQEEENRRQEAEARRKVEEAKKKAEAKAEAERRAKIQAERKSAAQCVMCGRPLTFLQKMFGKDRHRACKNFVEVRTAAPTTQQKPVASTAPKQGAMVLFLFNSDTPPSDANASYGAFSETTLLKHLFAHWNTGTGQDIANAAMKACHGDLFERHPLGDSACTLRKLGKMMQEGKLDGSRLGAEFDLALRKSTTVGFIPWAIGLCPVPDSVTAAVHEALKAELPDFYLGVVSLPPSHQFESTATNLALPQTMRIQKGKLVGDWQGKAP